LHRLSLLLGVFRLVDNGWVPPLFILLLRTAVQRLFWVMCLRGVAGWLKRLHKAHFAKQTIFELLLFKGLKGLC
jgi:hypothetical protein